MKSILIVISLLVSGLAYGQTAEEYREKGYSKLNKADFKGAIADYNNAIWLGLNDAFSYHNRGVAKNALDDHIGAIADFTKAIELDPSSSAYYKRGTIKGYLGDHRGAIADFTNAIKLHPNNNVWIYEARGRAKNALDDHIGAIADFTKAIELNPYNSTSYYNRGTSKIKLGQKDDGCMDLSKAGELGLYEAYNAIQKHCN